jgi:hypothetical protein
MASRWVAKSWALLETRTYAAIIATAYQTARRLVFSLIGSPQARVAPGGGLVSVANTALNATARARPTETLTVQKAEFSFALISQSQNGFNVRTAKQQIGCAAVEFSPNLFTSRHTFGTPADS